MSVFQSVKDKLKNVQADIKSSFRSLSLNNPDSSKKNSSNYVRSPINSDTGAELLDRFQSYWSEIHQTAEENAKTAAEVDKNLNSLLLHIEQQSLKFEQLSNELGYVKFINEDIQKLHGSLANLEICFRGVENELEQLEDVCDEVEFHQNCAKHQEQFKSWQESRVKDLQELKVKMSKEHVKKVQDHELRKQEQLRMRQEAFHDAFMSDMDQYRKLGKVDRTPSPCSDSKLDISDIELDQDENTLDEFLNADNDDDDEIVKDAEVSDDIREATTIEDDISVEGEVAADACVVQKADSELAADSCDG